MSENQALDNVTKLELDQPL